MSKRILLVDDDPSNRYATAKALAAAGYDVVAAADYIGALNEIGTQSKVDLLLTDIVMPSGMNGFALGRMARMRQRDLRIIYMTAYDVPKDEAIGPVLRKPLEASALVAEVEAALAKPFDQMQHDSCPERANSCPHQASASTP